MIDDAGFEGLKRGDASAFETLVEMFEAPLFRFFFCERGRRNLAEELTAETFAQLVSSLPKMRGDRHQLRAFVFATARHVRSHHWRKASRSNVALDAALDAIDPGRTPPQSSEQAEQISELMRAIQCLDPDVRTVVLLRFMEEFSIREISTALDIPAGTVKSHLHRGKHRLKQLLVQAGCEP